MYIDHSRFKQLLKERGKRTSWVASVVNRSQATIFNWLKEDQSFPSYAIEALAKALFLNEEEVKYYFFCGPKPNDGGLSDYDVLMAQIEFLLNTNKLKKGCSAKQSQTI